MKEQVDLISREITNLRVRRCQDKLAQSWHTVWILEYFLKLSSRLKLDALIYRATSQKSPECYLILQRTTIIIENQNREVKITFANDTVGSRELGESVRRFSEYRAAFSQDREDKIKRRNVTKTRVRAFNRLSDLTKANDEYLECTNLLYRSTVGHEQVQQ